MSIVNYEIPYPGPTIDTLYFLNTKSYVYWSSTPNVNDPNFAWVIYFYNGRAPSGSNKLLRYYVRCVHGEEFIFRDFQNNGDGTVTNGYGKVLNPYVRCVRGGQSGSSGNLEVSPSSHDFGETVVGTCLWPQ